MSDYVAPLKDMRFVLTELAGMAEVAALPGYEEASEDVVGAILEEAAKFAGGVLAPLNPVGDREGARWADRAVTMPTGFKDAYRQFSENGWGALDCSTEFGGQGLPKLIAAVVSEMWRASNHAFSLCPLLTRGAIEAIELTGSDEQKATYLPKMISGEWTGTMNLTEPQAGSDLAAVRTRAEPQADGSYRIFGQKIFITYGDHDMADNIVHLVLARLPDAPEGVKGISLFVVPKFLVNADGSLGARNDAYCVSIEHKLGIHASPTAVMAYGDNGGATGYLIGRANDGLKYMFIMMNAARYSVGLEGLGLSERAYQMALAYAKERVQGRAIEGSPTSVPIVRHPDVRRMLMLMKSQTEAMRALAYTVAAAIDKAIRHPDEAERARQQAFVDLMIPVVKGWLTETGNEITWLGVQVHGGMGYIEETGAAQLLRDARITTIYEGTTGIQANDLIGRKLARDRGAVLQGVIGLMRQAQAGAAADSGLTAMAASFASAIDALEAAARSLLTSMATDVRQAAVGAVPFLKLLGMVAGGWMMVRAAMAARKNIAAGSDDPFYPTKVATADFYAAHVLALTPALSQVVIKGGGSALAIGEELL